MWNQTNKMDRSVPAENQTKRSNGSGLSLACARAKYRRLFESPRVPDHDVVSTRLELYRVQPRHRHLFGAGTGALHRSAPAMCLPNISRTEVVPWSKRPRPLDGHAEGFSPVRMDGPTRQDRRLGHRTIDSHHSPGESRAANDNPCAILPNNAEAETELRAYATFQRPYWIMPAIPIISCRPTASLNHLIRQRRPCSDTAPTKWWASIQASFTFRKKSSHDQTILSEEFGCTVTGVRRLY